MPAHEILGLAELEAAMSLEFVGLKEPQALYFLSVFRLSEEFGKCEHLLPCRLFP